MIWTDGFIAFVTGLLAVVLMASAWRRQQAKRRRELAPFRPEWRQLLDRRLAVLLRRLSPEQRRLHERRVVEFLADIRIKGCNGFVITDEVRVLIAGFACLLLLRPDAYVFRGLRTVLVYPTAFWVRHHEPDELGLVSDEPELRLGESWNGERVVLSWEDVEAALDGDAVNVLVHEFAHQLDAENPETEGAPLLPDYTRWSKVMLREYKALEKRSSQVLDDYGLEGPTEFFAVATEAYFQRGTELRLLHAELYGLLRDYYRIETSD